MIYAEVKKTGLKTCARCEVTKTPLEFPRDSAKASGIASTCKACKSVERKKKSDKELARWKRYYAPGTSARKRLIIRGQTRQKYGPAKAHKCACGSQAVEWHHIEYTVDSVIPVCRQCHPK